MGWLNKILRELGITQSQWRYFRHWLILLVVAEAAMLVANQFLYEIYLGIAAAFLAGFILRVTHLYPGEKEPLILDASAVLIALLFASLTNILSGSGWRFLLIFCSSLIIFPHFVYIWQEK